MPRAARRAMPSAAAPLRLKHLSYGAAPRLFARHMLLFSEGKERHAPRRAAPAVRAARASFDLRARKICASIFVMAHRR